MRCYSGWNCSVKFYSAYASHLSGGPDAKSRSYAYTPQIAKLAVLVVLTDKSTKRYTLFVLYLSTDEGMVPAY